MNALPLEDLSISAIAVFYRCLDTGEQFHASGQNGLRSVAVTAAVLESAQIGRAHV